MSNRSMSFATFACAVVALTCAFARPARAQETPPAATEQKAAPGKCTTCKVEVENRYDYQALVFDKRETSRADVGTVKPLGKVLGKSTIVVLTKGRPNMGITVHEDTGMPPASSGLKNCRQEAVRPGTDADFRYACGN